MPDPIAEHLEVLADALATPGEGTRGIDWIACVPPDEWADHQDRLRSVIDAQDFAANPDNWTQP